MTHRSTALAELRETDRLRQRRRRARMKELGIPAPHQCDNAIAEALSFSLAIALAGKTGGRSQRDAQVVNFGLVFSTAMDILTKRWRFSHEHAGKALKARLAKRAEHSNPYWLPHFPSCEPATWSDMSASEIDNTPVTPSGHVRPGRLEVTQI